MNLLHEMLVEDEIFLCGIVLVLRILGRDCVSSHGPWTGKEGPMNMLFAHHVELMHVPVLAMMFGAGFWLGWLAIARLTRRGEAEE